MQQYILKQFASKQPRCGQMLSTLGPYALRHDFELGYDHFIVGTAVAQLLTCCATNPKAAGSIPDVVVGNFH